MKEQLKAFYLDWVNNFLTISVMSDYYDLLDSETIKLIEIGKRYLEQEK